jgi:hypothetical protein
MCVVPVVRHGLCGTDLGWLRAPGASLAGPADGARCVDAGLVQGGVQSGHHPGGGVQRNHCLHRVVRIPQGGLWGPGRGVLCVFSVHGLAHGLVCSRLRIFPYT